MQRTFALGDGLPAPDGHGVRPRRLALRDRVGLGLRRQQRRLGHLPDRLHQGRRGKPIAHATATPDSGPLPLEVQFSCEGSVDPEGTSLTYAWDFDGDGDTDSTDPNPTHTYTTAGTFTAKLTVTDQSGARSGVDNVPVVAGNTRPEVDDRDPGGRQVRRSSATSCPTRSPSPTPRTARRRRHRLRRRDAQRVARPRPARARAVRAPGLRGHVRDRRPTAATAPTANIFTVDRGDLHRRGRRRGRPLTGRDEAILQPKRKQAEYFDDDRPHRGRPRRRRPGRRRRRPRPTRAAARRRRSSRTATGSRSPVQPRGPRLGHVPRRLAAARAARIELRYDAADGPLVAATPNIAPTGGWQTWTDVTSTCPATCRRARTSCSSCSAPEAATGALMNLNWFRFTGKGAAVTAPPVVTRRGRPRRGRGAARGRRSTARRPTPEGEALTYEWDFGVARHDRRHVDRAGPDLHLHAAGQLHGHVHGDRRRRRQGERRRCEVRVTAPPDECPTGPVRSDEFDGDALDTEPLDGAAARRRASAVGRRRQPQAADRQRLDVPGGTTAKNLIVQDHARRRVGGRRRRSRPSS